ncbi:MAG: ABC transporter permease, partial [Bacteroidales bacterium]|nr:ABC transporter permease [Bacteroidales bacterium]
MDILQEIWSGLRHNKLRTVLTGLSVSWGIFILIILLAAGNGLKNGVTSNFSDRATNTVQIWPGRTSKPHQGYQSGRGLSLTNKEVQKIDEDVREMTDRTPVLDNYLTITNKAEYGSYSVRGVTPLYTSIFNLKFAENGGRFINQTDMNEKRKVIVLDKKVVDVLFKDEPALGKFVQVGQVMFQVVGINTKKDNWGNGNAYIPLSTSQAIFNPDEKYRSIAMTVNGLKTM